jgi:hypothetical protein
MAQTPADAAKWQTPPAYDFRGGDLRIIQGGEVVAVFAADRLPAITLDLVRALQERLRG